jgi:hypothetical protein
MAIKPSNLVLGTQPPVLKPDKGAGKWNSEAKEVSMHALKVLLTGRTDDLPTAVRLLLAPVLVIPLSGITIQAAASYFGGDDAVKHLLHYLGNTGSPYTIDFAGMNKEVALAKQVQDVQVETAQNFIEAQPPGTIQFTSTTGSLNHYIGQGLSKNWFFAVGSYSTWIAGTGHVRPTGGGLSYSLDYELHFVDRYNWDGGKSVDIPIPGYGKLPKIGQDVVNSLPNVKNGQLHVTDEFMAKFHRQGLAQEFDMLATIKQSITWQPQAGFVMYKVKAGDSLSSIAKIYYGDMNQYGKIHSANKAKVPNANLIHVGQELKIPLK